MEIREAKLTLKESLEEKFRAVRASQEESE